MLETQFGVESNVRALRLQRLKAARAICVWRFVQLMLRGGGFDCEVVAAGARARDARVALSRDGRAGGRVGG